MQQTNEVLRFYSKYGVVNSVGETFLDENSDFDFKNGKPALVVYFEKLYHRTVKSRVPNTYKGVSIKLQLRPTTTYVAEEPKCYPSTRELWLSRKDK